MALGVNCGAECVAAESTLCIAEACCALRKHGSMLLKCCFGGKSLLLLSLGTIRIAAEQSLPRLHDAVL